MKYLCAFLLAMSLLQASNSLVMTATLKGQSSFLYPNISYTSFRIEGGWTGWVSQAYDKGAGPEWDSYSKIHADASNNVVAENFTGCSTLTLAIPSAQWRYEFYYVTGTPCKLFVWDESTGVKTTATSTTNATSVNYNNLKFSIGSFYETNGPSGNLGFLRMYTAAGSANPTLPPPRYITASYGDVFDYEFEEAGTGQPVDSSANARNFTFTAGTVSHVTTPLLAPAAALVTSPTTVRAGAATALDGSASFSNTDTAGLPTCIWQEVAGLVPKAGVFSAKNACTSNYTPPVFGDYTLQLGVIDTGGVSSTSFEFGAVGTDANNAVIVPNSKLATIMDMIAMSGSSPWSYYDNRMLKLGDYQINTEMVQLWTNYWDTAATGTISVTNGNKTLTGTGTTFQTDFCGGGTVPVTGKTHIVIWYPSDDYPSGSSTIGDPVGKYSRGFYTITSCDTQTQITLSNSTGFNHAGTAGSVFSGLNYSIGNDTVSSNWNYGRFPGNYYDTVLGLYRLWYATGLNKYRDAARTMAYRFWTGPNMSRGVNYRSVNWAGTSDCCIDGRWSVAGPARGQSITGLVLWAIDQNYNLWPGLRHVFDVFHYNADIFNFNQGWNVQIGDMREFGYELGGLALCSLYDPDTVTYGPNCATSVARLVNNLLFPLQRANTWWYTVADYQFTATGGTTYATLTNGSTAVTLTGVSTNNTQFTQATFSNQFFNGVDNPQVTVSGSTVTLNGGTLTTGPYLVGKAACIGAGSYPTCFPIATVTDATHLTVTGTPPVGTQSMAILNYGIVFITDKTNNNLMGVGPTSQNSDIGDSVIYYASQLSSATSVTLSTAYAGTTGQHGMYTSHVAGFGQLPFMIGLATGALAGYARPAMVATGTNAAEVTKIDTMVQNSLTWLSTTAYDSAATYAGVTGGMFGARGYVNCETGNGPDSDPYCASGLPVLGEAFRGYARGYVLYNNAAVKTSGDGMFETMWHKPSSASFPQGNWTGLSAPTGTYMSDIDDNQYMVGPAANTPTGSRWFGFFNGYGFTSAWPVARLGGTTAPANKTYSVAFSLPAGATQIKLFLTQPDGTAVTPVTCASSPCSIVGDNREGPHSLSWQYLTAGNAVIAASDVVIQ